MKKILLIIMVIVLCSLVLVFADFSDRQKVNLEVYYAFDETSGTTAEDYVANIDGDIGTNVTINQDGLIDRAYYFSGNHSYVNVSDNAVFDFGTGNFSISGWVLINTSAAGDRFMGAGVEEDGNNEQWFIGRFSTGEEVEFGYYNGGVQEEWTTGNSWEDNRWYHFAFIRADADIRYYWNGSNVYNYTIGAATVINSGSTGLALGARYRTDAEPLKEFMNGSLDEIGIWTRALNQSEIDALYNNHLGLAYGEATPLSLLITLVSPEDDATVSTTTVNLTANYSVGEGYNFTNVTQYVWNSTGIYNDTLVTALNGTSNSTTETVHDLELGEYNWNVLACWVNASAWGNCSFADANYTFTVTGFNITGQTWENITTEGNLETFTLNLTTTDEFQISTGHLVYNGTKYLGTWEDLGSSNYQVTRELVVPNVTAETNYTFYWSFFMENTFLSFEHNTTAVNQTVKALNIDDCTAYNTLLLNYTLRDEESKDFLNENSSNTSMEIDLDIYPLGSSDPILNFSQNFSYRNPAQICLENDLINATYRMYVTTRYESAGRVAEFHNIQNFSLINSSLPQNINLYDLNTSDSQKFLITFKDSNFLPVEDALVDIQRKYIADGVFRSVEIPKTDEYGQTVGHFDLDSVIYTIVVSKFGDVLATFDNIAVICQDLIIEDCRLNLNAITTGTAFTEWETIGGLTYTMSFDEDTRTVTVIFTTTDGSTSLIELNTTKYDRFGNDTVCSDDLTSSSGTLNCVIPASYGNVTVVSNLFNDGELVTSRIYRIIPDVGEYFGTDGTIMVLIMMITIPLMLASSTIGIFIGVILGLIMAGSLFILKGGSVIGVGFSLIWAILAGGIIIWKISRRET